VICDDKYIKDLFKFNTKLTYIYFVENKLLHIDSNVLDSLTQLKIVSFSGNPCIDVMAVTPIQIQELKNEIVQSCQNLDVARKHLEQTITTSNPIDTTKHHDNETMQTTTTRSNPNFTAKTIIVYFIVAVICACFIGLLLYYHWIDV